MILPEIVERYFEADRMSDAEAVIALFAPNAVVKDEGDRLEGVSAIRNWWTTAKAKYRHVALPLEAAGTTEDIAVCAIVTGKFPNSPATLTFRFALDGDRIVELEIN